MKLSLYEGCCISENATVLLGLPSNGNIGQLAVDLVLTTIWDDVKRIGYIDSDHLLPMAGYEYFGNDRPNTSTSKDNNTTLCLSAEIYFVERSNLVIIQQRAPCHRAHHMLYSQELVEILRREKVAQVIALTGASPEGFDTQALGISVPREKLCPPSLGEVITGIQMISFDPSGSHLVVDRKTGSHSAVDDGLADPLMTSILELSVASLNLGSVPRGMTSARALYAALQSLVPTGELLARDILGDGTDFEPPKSVQPIASSIGTVVAIGERDVPLALIPPPAPEDSVKGSMDQGQHETIPILIFGRFCSEGDNRIDARMMALSLGSSLGLFDAKAIQLREPYSWQFLFGPPMSTGASQFF